MRERERGECVVWCSAVILACWSVRGGARQPRRYVSGLFGEILVVEVFGGWSMVVVVGGWRGLLWWCFAFRMGARWGSRPRAGVCGGRGCVPFSMGRGGGDEGWQAPISEELPGRACRVWNIAVFSLLVVGQCSRDPEVWCVWLVFVPFVWYDGVRDGGRVCACAS